MKILASSIILVFSLLISSNIYAQKKAAIDTVKPKNNDNSQAGTFSGLRFRNIGPALVSGRIVDLAVNPKNI